ncbi:hypothetical protein M422DRAFT_250316 [Sphaerobolus stellatus SS14]|uniref:Uncharacterized protein n=1 Tax=Sphaerobolus stellatus (strain SS14) TaxID=990650 RepID=A0A0C9W4F9_SPHS4|nr:hypothetical protein M422DRAFT_250316 [Sphaerobolus stellatus SS14]
MKQSGLVQKVQAMGLNIAKPALTVERLNELQGSGKASNSFATSMLTETIEGETTMTEYDFQGAVATTYGDVYLSRLDPHCLSIQPDHRLWQPELMG